MPKKKHANQSFGLIVVAYVKRHELNFFSCNLFLAMVLILFHFLCGPLFKKLKAILKLSPLVGDLELLRLSIRYS